MICLFGGTFDPVHNGHLHGARIAADRLSCNTRLVLSARPPHRPAPVASPEHRWAMLETACAGVPELIADDSEAGGVNSGFTVDTLRRIRSRYPDRPVFWAIGMDAFRVLRTWHRWPEVFDLAHLLLLNRPGSELDAQAQAILEKYRLDGMPRSAGGGILEVDASMLDISASGIRRCLAEGRPVSGLLPQGVQAYIRRHGLYAGDRANS